MFCLGRRIPGVLGLWLHPSESLPTGHRRPCPRSKNRVAPSDNTLRRIPLVCEIDEVHQTPNHPRHDGSPSPAILPAFLRFPATGYSLIADHSGLCLDIRTARWTKL